MQNRTSRFLQRPNEWELLINGHADEIGSTTKRLGFKEVGANQMVADKSVFMVQSGGTYLYASTNDADSSETAIYVNSKTDDPVTGTWSVVAGGTALPASCYVQAQPFAEIKSVFFAGSNTTAAALTDFMYTQKATYADSDAKVDSQYAPRSRWIIRYRDRIYQGYCAKAADWTGPNWNGETVDVKPHRVIFSNAPATGALTFENQGASGYKNFIDLDNDNTGLGTNNDQIILFTSRSMTVRYGSETIEGIPDSRVKFAVGCSSGFTIRNLDIYTFWYNTKGIWVYSGGKPEKISTPIQPIIDLISSPSACFADTPDDDHYRLWVGTLTIDGKTFYNCVINYTLSTNSWSVYSHSVTATPSTGTFVSFGSYTDSSRQHLYAGTSDGRVVMFSDSADSSKTYSDGDQSGRTFPIQLIARTPKLDYGLPHEKKDATDIVVYSTSGQQTAVAIAADQASSNGQFVTVGKLKNGIDRFSIPVPAAYYHQIEFTDNSTVAPTVIQGFSINVRQDTSFIK